MYLTRSAGKPITNELDWFWPSFWLDEKVARVFLSQSYIQRSYVKHISRVEVLHRSHVKTSVQNRVKLKLKLQSRDNRFFFLWEKIFFLMQSIFIVPAIQHGCRARPLETTLKFIFSAWHRFSFYTYFAVEFLLRNFSCNFNKAVWFNLKTYMYYTQTIKLTQFYVNSSLVHKHTAGIFKHQKGLVS